MATMAAMAAIATAKGQAWAIAKINAAKRADVKAQG